MNRFKSAVIFATSLLFSGAAMAGETVILGSSCKPMYESAMPAGYTNYDGQYIVNTGSVLLSCPLVKQGVHSIVDRILVFTEGVSNSDPSYVRCWATRGTDRSPSSRNFFDLQGYNLEQVNCLLKRHDRISSIIAYD